MARVVAMASSTSRVSLVLSGRSTVGHYGRVPMRIECKHYESRTYANGETVRKCDLDLAPEAPWRCPENCAAFEPRLADVNWKHGSVIAPPTPEEPPGLDDGAAELLDEAEEIINAAGPAILGEITQEKLHKRWRRWWRR